MTESIEIDVGELYANLHEQYSEGLGEQYEERVRQNVEDFLHNFNQQVERQQDAARDQQGDGEDALEIEE